ncbi:Phosphate transport system permease protein pstA [Morganella morganii]|nr:Phosphate transport system permease protein pstA [Morganella morganii]
MAEMNIQQPKVDISARQKRQFWRRQKNRVALFLSMSTMAFGLFWLIWILFSTVTKGMDGMSLALFTEMTPPPNTEGGGSGERHCRFRPADLMGDRYRDTAGYSCRDLSGGIRP